MTLLPADIDAIATAVAEKLRASMPEPVFSTKTGIAKHLGINRKTVTAWIEQGRIIVDKHNNYKVKNK